MKQLISVLITSLLILPCHVFAQYKIEVQKPSESQQPATTTSKIPVKPKGKQSAPLFNWESLKHTLSSNEMTGSEQLDKRVSLDLDSVSVRDAIKDLFTMNPHNCIVEVEKDVSQGSKITLRVKNVRFVTALNAVTEQADLIWSTKIKIGQSAQANNNFRWQLQSDVNAQYIPQYLPQETHVDVIYHISNAPKTKIDPTYDVIYQNLGVGFFQPFLQFNDLDKWNLPDSTQRFQYQWSSEPIRLNYNLDNRWLDQNDSVILDTNKEPIRMDLNFENRPIYRPIYWKSDTHLESNNNPARLKLHPETQPQDRTLLMPNKSIKIKADFISVNKDPRFFGAPIIYTELAKQDHATFSCPQCHKQVTIALGMGHSAPDEWHYCPLCGKKVKGMRPEGTNH